MKTQTTLLLFCIIFSLALCGCDNGESDRSMNNLSEFAKEFVSTHMDSYSSLNMSDENQFNQMIKDVLNMAMLMLMVLGINEYLSKRKMGYSYISSTELKSLRSWMWGDI